MSMNSKSLPKRTLKTISIKGLRSFGGQVTIELGIPNKKNGSGLTLLVGPNNAGKSTIIEAFLALSKSTPPDISEGKRNKTAGDRVSILGTNMNDETIELRTVEAGGSLTEWGKNIVIFTSDVFVLPSRRTFPPFFDRPNEWAATRSAHIQNQKFPLVRGEVNKSFIDRLFSIQNDKEYFNKILKYILDSDSIPEWKIEQSDKGEYYMRIDNGNMSHNSDGLGEGILSLFFIIDSLYDSKEGDIIVIDEPELSLHPSLQRKLAKLFSRYAEDRQIILATHSPYFIDWKSIINGAKIVRIVKENDATVVHQLSTESVNELEGFFRDFNNPHVLGLNANEAFFLDDRIILVEGQEDVIFYDKIREQLGISREGDFFGWGVGGAKKMNIIAKILHDLGFKKVVGILDKGMESDKKDLSEVYKDEYRFYSIPTEDVRTKKKEKCLNVKDLVENGKIRDEYKDDPKKLFEEIEKRLKAKEGLVDEKGNLRDKYKDSMKQLFEDINSYFIH